MKTETEVKKEVEVESSSPSNANKPSGSDDANGAAAQDNGKTAGNQSGTADGKFPGQFPPPKTDKPRPHVCGTCSRSFARLEHLKRHERSHTKEKPFECPECTRCFARRDLLLRHQQKLHMTNTAPRGPRSGRRESVSGTTASSGAKVRKNSVANANVGGPASNTSRPRANTISHLDLDSLGIFDGASPAMHRMNSGSLNNGHLSHGGIQAPLGFDYRAMPNSLGHLHGLPKLDTSNINSMDISNSLRTAPPQASFGDFELDHLFTTHATTINPAALHFGGATSMPPSTLPLGSYDMANPQQTPIDDNFSWMRNWNMQLQNGFENEQAIDESSPSRISSGDSPGDYNDSLANSNIGMPIQSNVHWQQTDLSTQQGLDPATFQLEGLDSGMTKMDSDTVSPSRLHDPTPTADPYFHQAMMHHNERQQQQIHQLQQQQQHHQHIQQAQSLHNFHSQPDMMQGSNSQYVGQAVPNFGSNSPSISSSSMAGSSARQSSVTSMSTDSITDSTRQTLLTNLSQPSIFTTQNVKKFSQPTVSSPLSPGNARMTVPNQGPTLPSTADIRRYVEAFARHAHPHLPVVHIPTLSFDQIESAGSPQGSSPGASAQQSVGHGGGRCLILGMAAIGALYEYDHPASKELFEAAKKMITLYLEERRRADMMTAVSHGGAAANTETPLWLVQAHLLTVIYGHHCGDPLSANIASKNIAALLSLARAAQVHPSAPPSRSDSKAAVNSTDVEMGESAAGTSPQGADLHTQWITWKSGEERKRVVYAIYFLSSLLTMAYNQAPTIMNSEIALDLPCAEELYNARSAEEWQKLGGLSGDERSSISFATALSTLLTASKRQTGTAAQNHSENHGVMLDEELKPSTYGCLILITALHNYIWETRHRHHSKEWTPQEIEAMFAHIEPALHAWHVAWKSNENHKLERPNPFGLGPQSADCVPLLDLAFVRLFVNMGHIAEAFWQRDFDGMAEQLTLSCDVKVATATGHENPNGLVSNSPGQSNGALNLSGSSDEARVRRERYLRKAAFYAADSLMTACNYNLTYTDSAIAHELPIQSAICFFDCAQVLGEWVTSVQERVGCFMGVLGRDPIDYTQVPAIMMLEAEDVELLGKIEHICKGLEAKRLQHESTLAMDINGFSPGSTNPVRKNVDLSNFGFGGKISKSVAMMLGKAVIWPITHVMAQALEVEAIHMERRTNASCQQ